ncbi:hypothetical protein [Marinomonas ostreistagni]|uniref:hypothetical protein n=1 Tax=Marinomonas ostreistagni TaxID=359209 RepID=UPI00194F7397|nr:hypothetical protein [Marinomonas ostreistagni]MBM6552112.1 hypothetical protein [Marinomonas ostreistagni]
MTLFTMLLIATGVSLVMLLASTWWYMRARRQHPAPAAEQATSTEPALVQDTAVHESSPQQLWLELLDQQAELCEELISEQQALGEDDLALRCWQAFLAVERALLEANERDVAPYLEHFDFVLERLKQAQEIDALLKQLSVSNSLLKELNKVVQKTDETVFKQMNITANLNLKLDSLQAKLQEEPALDTALSEIRVELATMYEFAERLRESIKTNNVAQDDGYLGLLEDFLGSAPNDSFLAPMKTELDEKVEELQHLAQYRSQVIEELKTRLKEQRGSEDGHQDFLAEYDVAFARMEKNLLESNKVIKALEHKLESLQTIKYNLNVDVRKREEELKKKDQALKISSASQNAQDALAREQNSVDALADLMDAAPLDQDLAEFEEAQSGKLAKLQQLINESELYVNVLEQDLDKEKSEHEQLLSRLNQESQGDELSPHEQEEMENLREVNRELENEKRSLQEQIANASENNRDVVQLQQRIAELDAKIETVQTNYVNMEERYLNSLMS